MERSTRKPEGMRWESWVDQQIHQAERRGDFASKSTGPIDDLDKPYDPDWWNKALIEREQLNEPDALGGPKASLRSLIDGIDELADEAGVRRRVQLVNERITILSRQTNGNVRVPQLDEEGILARWRAKRS